MTKHNNQPRLQGGGGGGGCSGGGGGGGGRNTLCVLFSGGIKRREGR